MIIKVITNTFFYLQKQVGRAISLTHLRQVDSSTTTLWTSLFPTAMCLVNSYYLLHEPSVFNANSVNPDQMQYSVAKKSWVYFAVDIFRKVLGFFA